MGVKSTIDISRNDCLNFIIDSLYNIDNRSLSLVVEQLNDALLEKKDFINSLGLHNFNVVDHEGLVIHKRYSSDYDGGIFHK